MYMLSVIEDRKNKAPIIEHFELVVKKKGDRNRYTLKGSDKKFNSVSEMLEYYRSNPISNHLKNIGSPIEYKQETVSISSLVSINTLSCSMYM